MKQRILLTAVLIVTTFSSGFAQTPPVVTSQTSIAGTGLVSLSTNDNDELAVIQIGTNADGTYIQFIVHNGSNETVSDLTVKIEVTDKDGKLVAVDTTDVVRPRTLAPNDLAIGWTFHKGGFDADLNISARVVYYEDGPYPYMDNIAFGDLDMNGDTIVGYLINESSPDRDEVRLVAICADASGNLITGNDSHIKEKMPIGEPISFQIDAAKWEDAPCETFIVAG